VNFLKLRKSGQFPDELVKIEVAQIHSVASQLPRVALSLPFDPSPWTSTFVFVLYQVYQFRTSPSSGSRFDFEFSHFFLKALRDSSPGKKKVKSRDFPFLFFILRVRWWACVWLPLV
jgi:hypothetical protein